MFPVLRVTRSLTDCFDDAASRFWSIFVVRIGQFLVTFAPDAETSPPVTGPILK